MPSTLLLDVLAWDLAVDTSGNIAVATEPYSLAQDAASAIKTFLGEVYYDTRQGVPYFGQILGQKLPISLMKAKFQAAALTVPGVVRAKVYITNFEDRKISGQVHIVDANGVTSFAGF